MNAPGPRTAPAPAAAAPEAAGDRRPREAAAVDLEACVEAARRGDARAFRRLYEHFAPVVHGIALARVGPGEADDVQQETFARLHRGLSRLRDPAALPGWLRRVATNAANDRLRRRRREPRAAALPQDLVAPAQDAGDARAEARLRARVLARIQELPEPYRETLVWRLVEGLTGPEISQRTGLTPGSVRVNLCRAMALLRPLLAKEGWR